MSDDLSNVAELSCAFAEQLLSAYAARGGNISELFAAFVGVVCQRDVEVGRDALIALDSFINTPPTSEKE